MLLHLMKMPPPVSPHTDWKVERKIKVVSNDNVVESSRSLVLFVKMGHVLRLAADSDLHPPLLVQLVSAHSSEA